MRQVCKSGMEFTDAEIECALIDQLEDLQPISVVYANHSGAVSEISEEMFKNCRSIESKKSKNSIYELFKKLMSPPIKTAKHNKF